MKMKFKITTLFIISALVSVIAAENYVPGKETLHEAAARNDLPAIMDLIEKGLDFHARNAAGETPLDVARKKGSDKAAAFLASLKKVRYPSGSTYVGQFKDEKEHGWGVMTFFNGSRYRGEFREGRFHGLGYWYYKNGRGYAGKFKNNRFDGRNELFDEKKVRHADTYGETILYRAARRGRITQVKLMIKRGASVNMRSNRKQTPLHFAAFEGYLSVAEVLLAAGAEVNPVDHDGMTPLHFAADSGKNAMVRLLIEKGARIDARNKLGVTPLMHAVYRDSEGVVKILLSAGAKTGVRDKNGRRAIDHARILKSYRSLRLLRRKRRLH